MNGKCLESGWYSEEFFLASITPLSGTANNSSDNSFKVSYWRELLKDLWWLPCGCRGYSRTSYFQATFSYQFNLCAETNTETLSRFLAHFVWDLKILIHYIYSFSLEYIFKKIEFYFTALPKQISFLTISTLDCVQCLYPTGV